MKVESWRREEESTLRAHSLSDRHDAKMQGTEYHSHGKDDLFILDSLHLIKHAKNKVEAPCFSFNESTCRSKSCKHKHVCVVCGLGSHGWSNCIGRKFCQSYSKGKCDRDSCRRRHWCLLCHEKHPMGDRRCQLHQERVENGDTPMEYCMFWNTQGDCKFHVSHNCDREHMCINCHSPDHGSFECTHCLETLFVCEFGGSFVGEKGQSALSKTLVQFPSVSREPSVIGDRGEKRKAEIPCLEFNKEYASCVDGGCEYAHLCIVCGSEDHGWSTCSMRKFCLDYSKGHCDRTPCSRRHWCMLCHEKHPMGDEQCEMFSQTSPFSYCFFFNASM
jgi:hypothetical protein